jgi:hypothetical protein
MGAILRLLSISPLVPPLVFTLGKMPLLPLHSLRALGGVSGKIDPLTALAFGHTSCDFAFQLLLWSQNRGEQA